MLTAIYIEALLVDEEAADQVWELWNESEVSTYWAVWMWSRVVASGCLTPKPAAQVLEFGAH